MNLVVNGLTRYWVMLLVAVVLGGCSPQGGSQSTPEIRLVLLLTVDQLPGRIPLEYRDKLTGGLGYLLENGAWFDNAHYAHAATFTSTGHATIATGADIRKHGIAGNDWYDRVAKRSVYAVSDPTFERSPANMTTETFGDVLIGESGGTSRVFSVSLKDRGAIIPAGHAGKAFWYSWRDGRFLSSKYYYEDVPDWVSTWNDSGVIAQYRNRPWELLNDSTFYARLDNDDRMVEKGVRQPQRGVPFAEEEVAFDQSFPHDLLGLPERAYNHALRHAPFADVITLDFARTLIVEEGLGFGDHTDVLAVSLSATDYIGHAFGPGSLEAEDNLYRLDESLADFFDFVDQGIGLENILIVLASDHGSGSIPETLQEQGIEAGRHSPMEDIAEINELLKLELGVAENLVLDEFETPNFYLDYEVLEKIGLDRDIVADRVASLLLMRPGYHHAITRRKFEAGEQFPTPEEQRLALAYHPERSGDVMVVPEKYWFLSKDTTSYSAGHGSPHDYDTHVPIAFAGPRVNANHITRPVNVRDIAPTISTLLEIPPPRDNAGSILQEVLPPAETP